MASPGCHISEKRACVRTPAAQGSCPPAARPASMTRLHSHCPRDTRASHLHPCPELAGPTGGPGAWVQTPHVPWYPSFAPPPSQLTGVGGVSEKRYYCSQCKAGPSRQFGIRIASPEKAGAGVHSSQSPDLIAGLGSNQEAEISRSTTATWGPGRVNLAPPCLSQQLLSLTTPWRAR